MLTLEAFNDEISELQVMALATRYNKWIFTKLSPYLGRRILEVGGGIGNMSTHLLFGDRLVTIDISPECVKILSDRFAQETKARVVLGDIADVSLIPLLLDEDIDSVVCINVLEHVEEDKAALENIRAILQPGGHLALLVPAHERLFGTLDEVVGHYRRYDKTPLSQKLISTGFEIDSLFYFNSFAALGRFLIGKTLKQKKTAKEQVVFYDHMVVPLLSRIENIIRPPFGQSLIAYCRKT